MIEIVYGCFPCILATSLFLIFLKECGFQKLVWELAYLYGFTRMGTCSSNGIKYWDKGNSLTVTAEFAESK